MRGLKISCETTDMEEEQERVRGLPAGPAASGLRPPPSRRCTGAVCRHCRWCVFQVYPADAAPSAATTSSPDRPHRIRPAGTALHTHPAQSSQLHQGEPLLPCSGVVPDKPASVAAVEEEK
ncbi:uncharacterized protein [Triticum aestivum]|uniref:uncharacterized protein n=1 Tax=Triticum aestivum TaxID=4565 RepID=UPI001D01A16E|nr:uncharacterized protein LOC123140691 [Triticum aestivum]